MRLKVKLLGFEAERPTIILNKKDVNKLVPRYLERVQLRFKQKSLIVAVNTTTKIISEGEAGVCEKIRRILGVSDGDLISVEVVSLPESVHFIRNKLTGRKLSPYEISEIVRDAAHGNLSDVELTAFVLSLYIHGLDSNEVVSLITAMVESGQKLNLRRGVICDKHSCGGTPGDKTSLIVVPIIASSGLTIPKTSSRAITSAAGTADRAEVLMPVNLSVEEVQRVVEKTNGCIVWGRGLKIAPVDDIFAKIEYSLSVDPLLLPSILAKKKAVGSTHVVIDIPVGKSAKIRTIEYAKSLAADFIEIGSKLGMRIKCALTRGDQPIGYSIGPALEAKEALEVLMRRKYVKDLIDKATSIAGILLEMLGVGNKKTAVEILRSGKAERKLREIIAEQGGDRNIKPEDIQLANYSEKLVAEKSGMILWMDNLSLVKAARVAGAPLDRTAGIVLHKKVGDYVRQGEGVLTVYSNSESALDKAISLLKEEKTIGVGSESMLIDIVTS